MPPSIVNSARAPALQPSARAPRGTPPAREGSYLMSALDHNLGEYSSPLQRPARLRYTAIILTAASPGFAGGEGGISSIRCCHMAGALCQ
jgi:hypothetical protein